MESFLGDAPDSVESGIPGEYWLFESDDIEEVQRRVRLIVQESLTCTMDGTPIPFDAIIVPLGFAESTVRDLVELRSARAPFIPIADLRTRIGAQAAGVMAAIHDRATDARTALCERLCRGVEGNGAPRYMWVLLDHWKGLWLSAEHVIRDEAVPRVTFVFFVVEHGLPFGDRAVREDGTPYEFIAGQRVYSVYMPGIVIGDEVPALSVEDHYDKGVQRLVLSITGRQDPVPVVLYDSLGNMEFDDDDDD
jgi:hypothetical protein